MSEAAIEMDGDDIAADIEAAMESPEEVEIIEEQAEEAPAEEVAEKEPAEKPDKSEDEKADKEAPVEDEPQQPDNSKGDSGIAPPAHWRGDAKIRWNKLPADVQQAIVSDYEQRAQTDAKYEGVENVLGDRWDRMAAQHGSVENALRQHVAIADFAERDPVGYLQWFAQQARIDLSAFGQQAQQPDPVDQKYAQLEQELRALKGSLSDQSTAQIQSQIEAFASDPAHPYFEDVRVQMGALIQSGAATDLADAYEKAIWADPVIRQRMMDEQRATAEVERAEKVTKAKSAKAIKGAPGAAGTANDAPASSIEEEIRRSIEELS